MLPLTRVLLPCPPPPPPSTLPAQGHDEPFLEQWHQKLHQNTTPQDVVIAEAYLAFLASGDHADWWRVLGERGLSAELLASWEQPITGVCARVGGEGVGGSRRRWGGGGGGGGL
jgi:hypothetical protein